MNRKNILFIATWFPNRTNPLNGIFIKRHANCASRIANLTVLTVQLDKTLPFYKLEIIDYQGESYNTTIIYYGNTHIGEIGKYLQVFRAYLSGISHLRRLNFNYDIIHANVTIHAGIIAKLLSKWSGKPFMITEHSSAYSVENLDKKGKLFYMLAAWACNGAKYLLPVSHSLMRGMIKQNIKGRYEVVPNVVNTEIFNNRPEVKKRAPFRFLHISGLDRSIKNPEGIIDAVKILSSHTQDFELIVAGNEEGKYRLKRYAKKIGLIPGINTYKGLLSEKEVARLMKNCHCFVLFSNFETQGCVLLEAQACGLPAICTKVGGIPEVLDSDKLGILTPPNRPDKLAEAMHRMMLDYDKYNSEQISNLANSRYSLDRVAQKIQAVYAST